MMSNNAGPLTTKQSEVEKALNVLERNIAELRSEINILSERIATILRVKAEARGVSEAKREIFNVPLAKRLEESSVACRNLIDDLGDILGRCEL